MQTTVKLDATRLSTLASYSRAMAALAPPHNNAGVIQPPIPANPATLFDITNAKEYVERLSSSKLAGHQPNAATDAEIGAAEAFKAAVVFSHSPGGNVAPAWLANLNNAIHQIGGQLQQIDQQVNQQFQQVNQQLQQIDQQLQQTSNDITALRQRSDEMPILLANSLAGTNGPLLNPTLMNNGWAAHLVFPNPRTRDELRDFTIQQCQASATDLGLPPLPPGTPVVERRRQIAIRIGVTI